MTIERVNSEHAYREKDKVLEELINVYFNEYDNSEIVEFD